MSLAFGVLFCILAVSAVFALIGIWEAFSDSPYAQAEKRRKANLRFKELCDDRETEND